MSARLDLTVQAENFPIAGHFSIARGSKTQAEVITVTVRDHLGNIGRGEAVPYTRYQESVASALAAVEQVRPQIEAGIGLDALQSLMPAGAARNAVDCALWDLQAKQAHVPVWKTARLPAPKPLTTAFTISLDTAEKMAEAAAWAAHRPLLKIKLGGREGDLDRIAAVRKAAPQAILIADANEGWGQENLHSHLQACADQGFTMVEQPLPEKDDEFLRHIQRPVRICADESVHDRQGLERLVGLYDDINIKLDKTGGLTEALKLSARAHELGFGLMIGCMVGTSLAMAPAFLLGASARYIDLDGPLLLSRDRDPGLVFENSLIHPPSALLWG